MTIIGDPLIPFLEVPGLDKPVENAEPPLLFSGTRQENRSLFLRESLDVLTWLANPENGPAECDGYRIYGVTLNDLSPLGDVDRDTFRFIAKRPGNGSALYAIAALDGSGAESELSFAIVR
jgi:hypothetical protein